jgi:exosortase
MAAASPLANHAPPQTRPTARISNYAIPAALLLAAHLPFLIPHFELLWIRAHYEFFPLVLIGAAVLARSRFGESGALEPGHGRVAMGLVGFSWLLLAGGLLLRSPWLGTVGGLFTLVAVVYGVGGKRLVMLLLPAWTFLWLIIPPPLGYDNDAILFLQRSVSRVSGRALDLLKVRNIRDGNLVVVAGRALLISKTCSGILSLLPILSCTFFFILWNRLSWWRALALLVAAAIWDFAGNVVRVLTIVVLYTSSKTDVTAGWAHEALGIFIFMITLGLITSTDFLLRFVGGLFGSLRNPFPDWFHALRQMWHWDPLAPMSSGEDPFEVRRPAGPRSERADRPVAEARLGPASLPPLSRTWLSSRLVLGAYCGLGLTSAVLLGPATIEPFRKPAFIATFNAFNEQTLPARSGAFVRQSFEPVRRANRDWMAEYSRAWVYRWKDRNVTVSVDYPFRGWHELTECYENASWLLEDRSELPPRKQGEGRSVAAGQAVFSRPEGELGFLLFTLLDERGDPLGRTGEVESPDTFGSRLQGKIIHPPFRSLLVPTFQVQLFTESNSVLSETEAAEARAFFDEIVQLVQQKAVPERSR